MSVLLWTIYDSQTEQTFEGQTAAQAVEVLRRVPTEQLAVWFGWHAGLSDWTPVLQVPEFAAELNPPAPVTAHAAPAALQLVPEPTPAFDADKTVFDFPVESTPSAATPISATPTEDSSVHIFWMADTPEGEPTGTNIDDLTGKFRYLQGHTERPEYRAEKPVVLPPESEHLAAQAETMPEEDRMGRLETPQRQASFALASSTDPSQAGQTTEPTGEEKRRYPRFDIRYRVIVRNDNLTFRTFSRNVSLGGVALEMSVPEALLGSECQIYVGNPKTGENIRFSGKLVANRTDSQYFVFLKSSPESLTKLQKWVESHSPDKKAV